MTKRSILVATATGLLAAGLLSGCDLADWDSNRIETAYEITDKVTKLDFTGDAGKVVISTGDGPIKVKETIKYGSKKPTASHKVEDGILKLVDHGCSGLGLNCSIDYEIRIPATLAVTLKTDAGEIQASGLSGDLDMSTDAGQIELTSLTSKKVKLRSQAGEVEAFFAAVPDSVDAETKAGRVAIKLPGTVKYSVDASTDAGRREVTVGVDSSSPHKIRAVTNAGEVEVRTT
ncbi:DUF4097 family beta strand repeat-containing protein [Longispora albida]|uniref:DUF4097 family beta strand repeat-containing protein n=1 Tax=Longispora albida TaxID=203523 RepID=UPI00035F91F5|nr:DUF4097 family beta strand repeat-containing protein [Longispora albida]